MVSVAEWKEAEQSQQVPNVHTQPLLPRQWRQVILATPWAVPAAHPSQVALSGSSLALPLLETDLWFAECGIEKPHASLEHLALDLLMRLLCFGG